LDQKAGKVYHEAFTPKHRLKRQLSYALLPQKKTKCRRQPVALEVTTGDHNFGQIAEALVTIGYNLF